jgi:hypothetical protein
MANRAATLDPDVFTLKDLREAASKKLPDKSDSTFFFAGSVLVFGREQRPLLPEPRVSIPEYGLST